LTKEKAGGQKLHNLKIKLVALHGCSKNKYPEIYKKIHQATISVQTDEHLNQS
jgi:hypothetical protein